MRGVGMPDGVMRWFDPRTGEAEVVRGGRTFPARAGDIETEARRPGARVHFDIRRVQGVEEAVDVRLRPGARVSHHHHRFGTLTGARRIDTKGPAPYAQVHPELRLAEVHPLEVARAWATSVAHGDIPGSIALYSADAVLHVADQPLVGRSAIGGWLTGSPLLGSAHHARIRGEEGTVAVSWGATGPDEPGMVVHCRIAHAQIVEQWVSQPEPPATSVAGGRARPFRVELSTRGDVGDNAKTGAQEAILRVVAELDEPVLFARVKLAWEPDPARPRPAVAQVALDVNGDLVRAHVAAHTMPEAIDLLVRRLRDRLAHRATYREQAGRRAATPPAWGWPPDDGPARGTWRGVRACHAAGGRADRSPLASCARPHVHEPGHRSRRARPVQRPGEAERGPAPTRASPVRRAPARRAPPPPGGSPPGRPSWRCRRRHPWSRAPRGTDEPDRRPPTSPAARVATCLL